MKPLVTVAIPASTPATISQSIKDRLGKDFSHVEIRYEARDGISRPIACSFDGRGVDFGNIDGDRNAPGLATLSAIHQEVNRAFREATSAE
jgi:hypothetical protein